MKFIKGHSRHMKRLFYFLNILEYFLDSCPKKSRDCFDSFITSFFQPVISGPWERREWEREEEQEEEEGERRKVGMKQTDWGIDMRSWNKINRKQKPPTWGTANATKLWTENPGRRLHEPEWSIQGLLCCWHWQCVFQWLTVERWSYKRKPDWSFVAWNKNAFWHTW